MELERSIWLISWIQILVYRSAVRGVSDFRNTLRQDEVGSGSRFIMGVLLSKSFYVCCFTNRMIFDYFSGLTFGP